MLAKTIGVLSLQGDFDRHIHIVNRLQAQAVAVRQAADLKRCHGLILPGGESTTIAMLMQRRGLEIAIQQQIQRGLAVFGTCAGMILLAKTVEGRSEFAFSSLDIHIVRNAYGSQLDSFETVIDIDASKHLRGPFPAVFIRAPRISTCSAEVEVLAEYDGYPVMVRQGSILATGFHPELTEDSRIHEFFINDLCLGYTS